MFSLCFISCIRENLFFPIDNTAEDVLQLFRIMPLEKDMERFSDENWSNDDQNWSDHDRKLIRSKVDQPWPTIGQIRMKGVEIFSPTVGQNSQPKRSAMNRRNYAEADLKDDDAFSFSRKVNKSGGNRVKVHLGKR